MQQKPETKTNSRYFIPTKFVFQITLIVVALTIICIWFFGFGQHRTLFENSILSTIVLSIAFFLFLSIGLYKGAKLKDDVGKISDRISIENAPDLASFELTPDLDIDEGIVGIIIGFLTWILFSAIILFFVWLFGTILWAMVLAFAAMLYWIFFRAIRLVFKNSNKCKNNLQSSILYGLGYTILYNFWIYGIILATHYLIK